MEIALDPGVQRALDALYEAMKNERLTEDAYQLAGDIVESVNAAEYSAWEWRWRCFVALDATSGNLVEMERGLMRRVATSNPKNYQLWNHRRKVALYCWEVLGKRDATLGEELECTEACLQVDTKNYHAWAHRQAMLRVMATEADLRKEFTFVGSMLERDVMNNSAWSQRAFLMEQGVQGAVSGRTWKDEAEDTMRWIELCVENEASWAYLAYAARHAGDYDGYAEFIARMLKEHPTSVEAGAAAFQYYKDLRDHEVDDVRRAALLDTMRRIRDRLVMLDRRRAHRFEIIT